MLKLINPATETLIQEVPTDDPQRVQERFQRARAAQPAWAARPLAERLEIIQDFKQRLRDNEDRLASQLSAEMGKPQKQALGEIRGVAARLHFFLQHTEETLQPQDVSPKPASEEYTPAMQELITYEPLGVIANISAWNYPYFIGANVIIPALLTGNAVLYKPSEYTTLTGLALAKLLHEAGVPEDIFQAVIGAGDVGAALTELPLNGFFFTGSYPTGARIAQAAAKHLAKVQLELGGKDPSYACEDVDIEQTAAALADGAFYNTGQSCCSVERIYVHTAIYDAFVEAFVKQVQGFAIGDPMDEGTYIGPLARQEQLSLLEAQVKDAVDKGARLLTGGQRLSRKGYYFAPTVLADVDHTMELMREESFGPIIGIQRVKDDHEAISLMNDTTFGLTAGVFTPDKERAQALMSQLNAGSVYWNCCDRVSPRLPWTGRQQSGIGSTLSRLGILTFVQPKAWHLRTLS